MLYFSFVGVGFFFSVGKFFSLFILGVVFFFRGVGLVDFGESLELALLFMFVFIDGGIYFFGLVGVVFDLFFFVFGVVVEIIFVGLNNCFLLSVYYNEIFF